MQQMMGTAADSRERGQGESEWVPMAEGVYRFNIGKPAIALSPFKNDDGSDKYRVEFPLALTEAEYERAKSLTELQDGQQLSGRCWYRIGVAAKYPLGFYRDGQYVSTKLADFFCVAFGSAQVSRARKYLAEGGGPDFAGCESYKDQLDRLEAWLGWIEDMQVYGTISHSEDKKVPGKFWGNFGGPLAVGSLPNQAEPDYQALGKGKLRACMVESQPAAEAPAPEPAREPVAAGAGGQLTPEQQAKYESMFGADEGAEA